MNRPSKRDMIRELLDRRVASLASSKVAFSFLILSKSPDSQGRVLKMVPLGSRFFSFLPKKNDISYGVRIHSARHRGDGGGSTLILSRHHIPRPAPLFPHSSEARRTHTNSEKPGVRSVARPQANRSGENIRV